jgi:pimeloyl-ACP methyl ester carboxylesterase
MDIITNPISLVVQNETLVGTIFSNKTPVGTPNFVFLHGAGLSTKEKIFNIAKPIIKNGIDVLAFDFSGHGESTGKLKKSSLFKRVNEAKEIINQFASKKPLTLCGASMGGFVAIKMLEFCEIDKLILLCPALYDTKAYHVPFDDGFTEIIRVPTSWRNSDALTILEKFTGKLLIIIGEKDEVIPNEAIDLLIKHTPKVKQKEIYRIPNCPHQMSAWLTDNKPELEKTQNKIMVFLSEST